MSRRLTIDIEDDDGAELDRLAQGQRTDAEAFARSLLTQLLRAQRYTSRTATELLDGTPAPLTRHNSVASRGVEGRPSRSPSFDHCASRSAHALRL